LLIDFGNFHSRFDNVINDSFNYTVTRHRWNCQELKYTWKLSGALYKQWNSSLELLVYCFVMEYIYKGKIKTINYFVYIYNSWIILYSIEEKLWFKIQHKSDGSSLKVLWLYKTVINDVKSLQPYFWKWWVFAHFLCTVVLSTSEKIAYMSTFKIMFDTSVIQ
jgi:hypothetical protein